MSSLPALSRSAVVAIAALACLDAAPARAGSAVASHGSVGFVPGQSIEVSVTNPAPEGSPAPEAVVATVRLLDVQGRDLAVSPVMQVGPGQTRTFIVRRSSLSRPGDMQPRRLQVRAETYLDIPSQPPQAQQLVITTAELVEDSTGKHSGMIGDVRTVISGE